MEASRAATGMLDVLATCTHPAQLTTHISTAFTSKAVPLQTIRPRMYARLAWICAEMSRGYGSHLRTPWSAQDSLLEWSMTDNKTVLLQQQFTDRRIQQAISSSSANTLASRHLTTLFVEQATPHVTQTVTSRLSWQVVHRYRTGVTATSRFSSR